jgi:hypothetical protein
MVKYNLKSTCWYNQCVQRIEYDATTKLTIHDITLTPEYVQVDNIINIRRKV